MSFILPAGASIRRFSDRSLKAVPRFRIFPAGRAADRMFLPYHIRRPQAIAAPEPAGKIFSLRTAGTVKSGTKGSACRFSFPFQSDRVIIAAKRTALSVKTENTGGTI